MDIERRWYLVHTRSSDEGLAQAQLERQGFNAYYPRVVTRKRLRGKRVNVVCPLFPRYLFVQLVLGTQDFSPVRSTKGVLGIVRFGPDYAIVPEGVVELLHGRADGLTGLHELTEKRFVEHGTVRITGGPFEHFEGIFLRESGEDRVVVLFNIVGQGTPVEISEEWVEPVISNSARQPELLTA